MHGFPGQNDPGHRAGTRGSLQNSPNLNTLIAGMWAQVLKRLAAKGASQGGVIYEEFLISLISVVLATLYSNGDYSLVITSLGHVQDILASGTLAKKNVALAMTQLFGQIVNGEPRNDKVFSAMIASLNALTTKCPENKSMYAKTHITFMYIIY